MSYRIMSHVTHSLNDFNDYFYLFFKKKQAAIYSADEDVAGVGVITKVQGEADYLSALPQQQQQPFSPQQMTTGLATTVVLTGFTAPFDKNGVLYYLGTNGGLEAYQNPHLIGAVTASMSSIYKGSVHNVVEQKRSIMPNYSNNTKVGLTIPSSLFLSFFLSLSFLFFSLTY